MKNVTVRVKGPMGLPISGHMLPFRRNPLAFLQRLEREYGEVAKFRIGPSRHLYLVSNPDMIKEIFVTKQASFRKGKGLQVAKAVVGEGLLTSEGKQHIRQRRLEQPAFYKQRIAGFADTMVDYTEQLLEHWSDGEERMFSDDMMALTLLLINKTMFGSDINANVEKVGHAIDVSLQFMMNKVSSFINIPLSVPIKSNVVFREAMEILDKVIYDIIAERRANPDNDGHDLLGMLLAARDENDGTGMSDEQVRDEVMTIFVAGHETTANSLAWTGYLLASNPEAYDKFLHEVDTVLAGRKPTMEDIQKMPYTNMVIQESMRLFPPAWAISREVVDDEVQIGEYTFTKGEFLMTSTYVMHRNPKYFDNPDKFLPERWEGGELAKQLPPFAYFPFGGGPRVCIGNNFALMEMALILPTIAQQYRLALTDKQSVVGTEPLITLRPKNGLLLQLQKR